MKKAERIVAEEQIRKRFGAQKHLLNERARRLFAAAEVNAPGRGSISLVSRATGLAASTIRRAIDELRAEREGKAERPEGRIRRPGAGRKKQVDKDPTLLADLKELVESTTRGDPESPLLWTARSLRNIVDALQGQGHRAGKNLVSRLLKYRLGYSLQATSKRSEGAQHPDRNAQFEHISEMVRRQLESGQPAVSVDTKKKELVGPYKNNGRELRRNYDPELVNAYDFIDKDSGKVSPYGVYDLANDEAWVSVGISHDTAEFAVHSIRTWWHEMGSSRHPDAESLLISAECGGSNGYRTRLWKLMLQELADELGLTVIVCHYPPGTSKWNKIEHRLFSFISQNWRGKPLITHQVIVSLIASTSTRSGLTVRCSVDDRKYRKGRRVTDAQLETVHLVPHKFHGEWNYQILPREAEG